jgi:hypothetical protein
MTLTHKWQEQGLGRAPFQFIAVISMPSRAIGEKNPNAYNQMAAECSREARHFGVELCTCNACGKDLTVNCIVRDADGKHFVVGSDCIRKVGDSRLESALKLAEKARRKAAAQTKRQAEWEAKRPEREAQATEWARQQAERAAQVEASRAEMTARNGWLLDVLRAASRYDGDFCSNMARSLETAAIGSLSDRAYSIVREIYGKARGRMGSAAFEAAVAEFDNKTQTT